MASRFLRTLAVLVFAALLCAAPQQARAQWLTFDASNAVSMAKQFLQMRDQLITMRNEYEKTLENLRRLDGMADWRGQPWLDQIEAAQSYLDGMSYVLDDIDAQFQALYGTERFEDFVAGNADQIDRTMQTLRAAVNTMRAHRLQIEDGIAYRDQLRADNERAEGNREVAQAQSNIALFAVENLQLLREQISALTTMQATQHANELSRQARSEDAGRNANASLKTFVPEENLPTRPKGY